MAKAIFGQSKTIGTSGCKTLEVGIKQRSAHLIAFSSTAHQMRGSLDHRSFRRAFQLLEQSRSRFFQLQFVQDAVDQTIRKHLWRTEPFIAFAIFSDAFFGLS